MPLGNRTDHTETETGEPIDIVLKFCQYCWQVPFDDKTHCDNISTASFLLIHGRDSPRKDSGFQLPSMALELIAVFIDTPKEVGSPMYIEHDPLALFAFPSIKVSPHLNPLGLQGAAVSSPLPPFLSSYLVNAMVP